MGGRLSERWSQQKHLLRRAGRCASVISLLSLLPAWTSASPQLSHVSLSAVARVALGGGTLEAGLSQSLPAHRPQPVLLQKRQVGTLRRQGPAWALQLGAATMDSALLPSGHVGAAEQGGARPGPELAVPCRLRVELAPQEQGCL